MLCFIYYFFLFKNSKYQKGIIIETHNQLIFIINKLIFSRSIIIKENFNLFWQYSVWKRANSKHVQILSKISIIFFTGCIRDVIWFHQRRCALTRLKIYDFLVKLIFLDSNSDMKIKCLVREGCWNAGLLRYVNGQYVSIMKEFVFLQNWKPCDYDWYLYRLSFHAYFVNMLYRYPINT